MFQAPFKIQNNTLAEKTFSTAAVCVNCRYHTQFAILLQDQNFLKKEQKRAFLALKAQL